MARKVICPICHKPAEVTSLHHFAFAHYCDEAKAWWYTNGILWSNNLQEVTTIPRR